MMFTSSEIRFILHGDLGHAWLEVPLSLIKEYGLEKDISSYSYVNEKSGMVFLEEDSDMPKFLKAFQRETGLIPDLFDIYSKTDSTVRNLPRYTGGEA